MLRPGHEDGAVELSAADAQFLGQHSGIAPATEEELKVLSAQSAARAATEAAGQLSRTAVADLLGVDVTRVSNQNAAGGLYKYEAARKRPAYPDRQFADRRPLPHLAQVLAALPAGRHPVTVRAFMHTTATSLRAGDRAVSPRDWLRGGGPVECTMAQVLGEQV